MLISKPISSRRPVGFGLVELMISSSLLMLLMALVFMLYFNSHRAWKKSSEHQQVMGEMQVALAFFAEDLQATSFDSVSLTPDKKAIGLLTMKDGNGDRHYGVDGRPIWDHWVLYYAEGQSLLRLDVPWPVPQSNRQTPVNITAFSSQPLSSFLTGDGRILSRNLQNFEVEVPPGSRLVHYKLTVEKQGKTNQTLTLEGTVQPRN